MTNRINVVSSIVLLADLRYQTHVRKMQYKPVKEPNTLKAI